MSLWRIVDYLAVDKASHARYQPRDGLTFCNIYAHDYCDARRRLSTARVVDRRKRSSA